MPKNVRENVYLVNSRFLFRVAFFWSRNESATDRSAQLFGYFMAFGFRRDFLNQFRFDTTFLNRPFIAFFFRGVPFGFDLAFVLFDCSAIRNVIHDAVLMIPGFAHGFVLSFAIDWSGKVAILDQGSMTNFNGIIHSDFLVLNEAIFMKTLVTFLFLDRFKIRGVGGLALFVIGMMTFHLLILNNLFDVFNFVNANLASFSYRIDS